DRPVGRVRRDRLTGARFGRGRFRRVRLGRRRRGGARGGPACAAAEVEQLVRGGGAGVACARGGGVGATRVDQFRDRLGDGRVRGGGDGVHGVHARLGDLVDQVGADVDARADGGGAEVDTRGDELLLQLHLRDERGIERLTVGGGLRNLPRG